VSRRALAAVLAAALLGSGAAGAASEAPVAGTPGASGIGDAYFPLDGNGGYDVAHYDVHDRMRLGEGRISGWTRLTATATQDLSRFDLDLLLTVDRVTVDGVRARFTRPNAHELQVTPARPVPAGSTFRVRVDYHGVPARTGWKGERPWLGNAAEVVTMNEPHMAAWWFPANDHPRDKATFDITVGVPRGRQAVANGSLVSRTHTARWSTWHWRASAPMAPYLAFFAAGDFTLERGRTPGGTPYTLAVSERLAPAQQRAAMALLRRTPRVLAWLEGWLGDYPFGTTGGLVTSLRPGFALENQTRPTYPYVGGPGSDWLLAHELAHQWVGDSVSVRGWRDIWLNEGLATFLEVDWDGNDGFATMQDWLEWTWESNGPSASFWDLRIGDPGRTRLFDQAVYVRGGMAVQALRHRIGETDFRRLLRTWVTDRRHGNGSVQDFVALAETVSGEDLGGFFDAWLFSPDRPARTAENGLA
jgi:aminopeptidase N